MQLDLFRLPAPELPAPGPEEHAAPPLPGLHVVVYTLTGPIDVYADSPEGVLVALRGLMPARLTGEETLLAREGLRGEARAWS